MSMASEVTKLIFAVLDVSFNSGHYTVIIKRQFLYINIMCGNERKYEFMPSVYAVDFKFTRRRY